MFGDEWYSQILVSLPLTIVLWCTSSKEPTTKGLSEGGDLRKAQVNIPRSVRHSSVYLIAELSNSNFELHLGFRLR